MEIKKTCFIEEKCACVGYLGEERNNNFLANLQNGKKKKENKIKNCRADEKKKSKIIDNNRQEFSDCIKSMSSQ